MYVQADARIQQAMMHGLQAKFLDSYNTWHTKFIAKHPALGWRVLESLLDKAKYLEFWKLHDELIKRNINAHWACMTHDQMHIATNLPHIPAIVIPLTPGFRTPYGRQVSDFLNEDINTLPQLLARVPEIEDDLNMLKFMSDDYAVLYNAAQAAINAHTSLALILKRAPFLTEFVDASDLSMLNRKAERKPREKKVIEEPSQDDLDAVTIAATRLRITQ